MGWNWFQLTHQDKMAAISQTIFSYVFSWKFYILIKISLKFIPKGPVDNIPALVQTINGLAPNRRQAIIWTNANLIHWRIYVWGTRGGEK